MPRLDDAHCLRALRARDARFDGVFFVGVTSTRIYCRPICPAPAPRADRCRFYASAAAAERRGFRPCLRCRPELAPADRDPTDVASVDAVDALARVAAQRIAAGALDRLSVESLACQLGVSDRHLRRALKRTLGAGPVELAQTRRLLTAKQLLTETTLPVAQVALAAGFASLRRFNALFQERYRLAPTALRTGARAAAGPRPDDAGVRIALRLAYRPPYDWSAMLAHLAERATPGVEWVDASGDGAWWRTVALDGQVGTLRVTRAPGPRGRPASALHLSLSPSLLPVLVPLLARVRRQFDLDASPRAVQAHLADDPTLGPRVRARPGLRVAGAFDAAQLALRTVLGQQVSVRGATTIAGRLVARWGTPLPDDARAGAPPALTHLPVALDALVSAGAQAVATVGLPGQRATALVTLARAIIDGPLAPLTDPVPAIEPSQLLRTLTALPGIGDWTAQYIAMRGLAWPDAFPAGDLVLRQAMGGLTAPRLIEAAERWRPWRAYAAHQLWAGPPPDSISEDRA